MVRWLINTNFLKKMFSIPSFLAVHGLCCCVGFSLVVATGGSFLVVVTGFSMQRLLLFQSTGSRVLRHQELQHVAQRLVWAAKQPLGKAALGALFA